MKKWFKYGVPGEKSDLPVSYKCSSLTQPYFSIYKCLMHALSTYSEYEKESKGLRTPNFYSLIKGCS